MQLSKSFDGAQFHYFDRFLTEYESRFEKQHGFLQPIIEEVTAGHHEARRAVVISECLAKGKRLLRHYVPRNKPRLRRPALRIRPPPSGLASGASVSPDCGSWKNGFNGTVKGAQLSIAEDDGKHQVDPKEAISIALARQ